MSLMDMYVHRDTPIHRLDPRVKITAAVFLTALCFFLSNILLLFTLFLILQLSILSTGVSIRRYSSSLWLVGRFALIFVILWPFFDKTGETVLLDLSIYRITLESFLRSLSLALRILVMASGWFLLLFSTTQSNFVRGLVKLGMPYDLGLSLSIALRYIPHFIETMDQVKDAQVSRGYEVDSRGPLKRAKNFIPVLIPTFVFALRTSEGISASLVSRGYGASPKRTYYRDIRLGVADAALIAFICVTVPASIILELLNVISI